MTSLLPELEATSPANVQLDGEIVALNAAGVPDFRRLGSRLLHGHELVVLTYFVFDVLAVAPLNSPRRIVSAYARRPTCPPRPVPTMAIARLP
jgi:hypothetical protein